MKYQAEDICIASIYYGVLGPVTLPHGPSMRESDGRSTLYELKPVPREKMLTKPFVLTVTDAFETVPNPEQSSGTKMAKSSRPVDVNQIADYLVRHWAGNFMGLPPGATPGIVRIKGTIPHQDEMKEMISRQTAFAEHMFNAAEKLVSERQTRWITQTMRDSSVWLKRLRPWTHQMMSDTAEEPCPFCRVLIEPQAYVCKACGRIVMDASGNKLTPASLEFTAQIGAPGPQPKAQPVS